MSSAAEDVEWRLLAELLEVQFGLEFDDMRRAFLETKLRTRAGQLGLNGLIDYYHYLRYHPAGPEETGVLKGLATNHESYFFRASHQLEVLVHDKFASLAARHPGPLRVLSAGCSCGEEPYSIAIHLERSPKYPAGYQIDAFDLDPQCIAQARSGLYRAPSLRSMPEPDRRVYFTPVDTELFALREAYRKRVRFLDLNLLGGIPPSAEPYDLVFCRNVLIYFSASAFERAIAAIASWMVPGGILMLGHSESLVRRTTPFTPELISECVVYRKK